MRLKITWWFAILGLVISAVAAILKPEQAYILNTSSDQARSRAFITCRRECVNRCDRLVYRYEHNMHYCHECLRECMYGFVNQARQVNVDFSNGKSERGSSSSRTYRHARREKVLKHLDKEQNIRPDKGQRR